MYSALKVNGKKLYELAREGKVIERKARDIEVFDIKVESIDLPEVTMTVHCSKGTYIRTLIHDIGEKLGCGGIMTELERTSSGGFTLTDCYTLAEVQAAADENRLEELILPIERVFGSLPRLRLNEVQTRMYRNGVKLDLNRINRIKQDKLRYSVYGCDGCFIGIAAADTERSELRAVKNFI